MWGPFLFSVNLLPLRKIITDYGVSYELYADDNQLYIVFNHSEGDIANIALGSVISDTLHWLTMNFQKVNDGKAEMMLISSMHLPPVEFRQFLLGYEIIMPADSFRNLGVQFDSKMRLDKQITSIVKMSFVNLKDRYQGRSCMSLDALETMVHAFIISCLDYCNSLLCGLPKNQIKKFQAIRNTAARLVTNSYKYDHIAPILKYLHWLPVQQQINFKILLFTFKYLHGQAPKYLQDLLI